MPAADRPFAIGVYLPRIIPFMSGNCISMNRTPSAASSAPIALARPARSSYALCEKIIVPPGT